MTDNSSPSLDARIKRNNLRCLAWTAPWVLSQALAVFGPKFLWRADSLLTLLAIVLNLVLGAGVIWAVVRWLRDLDELQKRIHLESFAVALGVGVIGGLNFSLWDMANLIAFDAEIGLLVMGMSVSYLATLVIQTIRYK